MAKKKAEPKVEEVKAPEVEVDIFADEVPSNKPVVTPPREAIHVGFHPITGEKVFA